MVIEIRDALGWRYHKYIEPYIDLHGSVKDFMHRKFNNYLEFPHAKVVYIYANRRNVGDYLSFLGLRKIVYLPGLELFAAHQGIAELEATLTKLQKDNRHCVLVIGGG